MAVRGANVLNVLSRNALPVVARDVNWLSRDYPGAKPHLHPF